MEGSDAMSANAGSDRVFVSYSSKDKSWADAACAVLESKGVRCWIAPRDIAAGSEWGAAIITGIDACHAMVLIFSDNANRSPQVRREVERALSKGLAILPCRVEDVRPAGAMEYALSNTHWLDVFTPPVEQHLKRLVEAVRVVLTAGRTPAAVVARPAAGSPLPEKWSARAAVVADPVRLRCPHCGKHLVVPASAAGKRLRCPACAEPVQRPAGLDPGGGRIGPPARRRPWAWFAGGVAVLALLVAVAIWAVGGGPQKQGEAGGTVAGAVDKALPPPSTAEPEPNLSQKKGSPAPKRADDPPAPPGKREWRVTLRHARLQSEYQEPGEPEAAVRTDGMDRMVAVVGIELEALGATAGSLQDKLAPGRDALSAMEMDFMADVKVPVLVKNIGQETASAVLAKPARLFLSPKAELVLPGGTRLRPTWTSAPPGLLTFTPRDSAGSFGFASKSAIGGDDPATLRFVRRPDLTAALVQPERKVALELVYLVPVKTEKAALRFYDGPPVDVSFSK